MAHSISPLMTYIFKSIHLYLVSHLIFNEILQINHCHLLFFEVVPHVTRLAWTWLCIAKDDLEQIYQLINWVLGKRFRTPNLWGYLVFLEQKQLYTAPELRNSFDLGQNFKVHNILISLALMSSCIHSVHVKDFSSLASGLPQYHLFEVNTSERFEDFFFLTSDTSFWYLLHRTLLRRK